MTQLVRSVQRVVSAPAAEIFDLLAEPARHAEFDGSNQVGAEFLGPQRLSLGAEFGMLMTNRIRYRSVSRVVEFEEGRRIAWQTGFRKGGRLLLGGQVWRYELTDRGDGTTLVRESFDLTLAHPAWALDRVTGPSAQRNIAATLERLAERFAG